MSDTRTAWLCRWDGHWLVVRAETIEQARLEARQQAGPHAPVSARLATVAEVAEWERGAA